MKRWFILTMITFIAYTATAQIDKMRGVLEDVQTEMHDGKFTLRFFDALTGDEVPDAAVDIKGIGTYTTDPGGKVQFEKQADGIYYFSFTKRGYITANYRFEVIANTIFYNRFTVSPRTELGAVRIVLDWDNSPADLDLHLIKDGSYHISYRNKQNSGDGAAQLDRDDTNGYGPETITIYRADNQGAYTCYVVDYTNSTKASANALSKSKATVRVYNNNELTNTFYVPVGKVGNKWNVFKIFRGEVQGGFTIDRVN
ncbi:MAG: hypothetical protein Q7J05_02925 [Paludibacter sp.]|nr:hypothetical protein [Paludibacter sp.]